MMTRPAACLIPLLLLSLITPALAQEKQTPRESFQNFIDAILIEEATEEQRIEAFDRYFDFATWLSNKEETEGKTYTEEERAALKTDWYKVFRSAEFRKRYSESGVTVQDSRIEGENAELTIALGAQQFRVLMTASADGTYWRWYDIPAIEKPKDPAARLNELETALQELRIERVRLNKIEDALLTEIAKLRAALAEKGAGNSPYATPRSVIETAWKAIEANDVNAVLDCHTSSRIKEANAAAVKTKVKATNERLMSWEILDSTIDATNPGLAIVRARIKFQRTGEPDDRTISVRVVRVGENWKIDEEP